MQFAPPTFGRKPLKTEAFMQFEYKETKQMKGYVLNGIRKVELKPNLDHGKCGDDQVLIKNLVASICGGDIAAYKFGGANYHMPDGHEFGHEMVSEIVEVGKDVTDLKVGQRVYPYPMTAKLDPYGSAALGGFSEYVMIDKARKDYNLYLVDDSISDKVASLVEPFTIAFHAANRSGGQAGQSAVVFGAGTIGVSAAIGLKSKGLDKVMVIDQSALRLDICKQLGFAVVNTKDADWKKQIIAYFGPARGMTGETPKVDVLLDAIGADALFPDIMSLASFHATVCVVGVHHDPVPIDLRNVTYGGLNIYGSGGYTPVEVVEVINVMKSKKFDIEKMITHVCKFDDFPEAIEMACDTEKTLKVIIDYSL
jgi:2-desacetyl-2-hydroxyethyl bacteriochlorophyllide A dehydrogenase